LLRFLIGRIKNCERQTLQDHLELKRLTFWRFIHQVIDALLCIIGQRVKRQYL
jgi:hypothetical protein